MVMKISDLPPGLKELAERRRKEDRGEEILLSNSEISGSFTWLTSPEGFFFWDSVDKGNFAPFYNCKVVNYRLKCQSNKETILP